jgi:hypothetical protein
MAFGHMEIYQEWNCVYHGLGQPYGWNEITWTNFDDMNYIEIDVNDNKSIVLMTQMPHRIWLIMFVIYLILIKLTTWMMNNSTWKNYNHEWKWFLSIYGVSYCEMYIYLNYSSQVSKLFLVINLHSCLLELNFKTNHFQPHFVVFTHIMYVL